MTFMSAKPGPSARPGDAPADGAARLLTRIGVFLLFVVSLSAPVALHQTIYILLPIGAALLLAGAIISPRTQEITTPLWNVLASRPVLAALLIIGWAACSLLWTPFAVGPGERLAKTTATLALVAVASAFLPMRTRVCNLNLLPIGVSAAAMAISFASAANFYLKLPQTLEEVVDGTALARSGVTLALILWPAAGALALRGRHVLAAALALVAALTAVASGAPNITPALVIGAVAFAVSYRRPRRAARVIGGAAIAIILLAPLVALLARYAPGSHDPKWRRALDIWGALFINGGARSLSGHGVYAAHYGLFGGFLDPHTPRSLLFQIWFDLGLLGAAAFAAMTAQAFIIAGRARALLAPFLIAGVVTGLVVTFTGPAAEQLWATTAAGLDIIAFVLVIRSQFKKKRPRLPAELLTRDDEEPTPRPRLASDELDRDLLGLS